MESRQLPDQNRRHPFEGTPQFEQVQPNDEPVVLDTYRRHRAGRKAVSGPSAPPNTVDRFHDVRGGGPPKP